MEQATIFFNKSVSTLKSYKHTDPPNFFSNQGIKFRGEGKRRGLSDDKMQ